MDRERRELLRDAALYLETAENIIAEVVAIEEKKQEGVAEFRQPGSRYKLMQKTISTIGNVPKEINSMREKLFYVVSSD